MTTPTISHLQGIISNFALIFKLDDDTEVAYDAGTQYLAVDLTDYTEAYCSFDYYPSTNAKVALDSDSADLQKLIEEKLFPILDLLQADPDDEVHHRDYPITD